MNIHPTKFVVELSNNDMPFSDDASYDTKSSIIEKLIFETKKEAKKFFTSKVKELGLMKTGRGSNLYGNCLYELYMYEITSGHKFYNLNPVGDQ